MVVTEIQSPPAAPSHSPTSACAPATASPPAPPPLARPEPPSSHHLDLLLKRWTSFVAERFGRRNGRESQGHEADDEDPPLDKDAVVEVFDSVFAPRNGMDRGGAVEEIRPPDKGTGAVVETLDHQGAMSHDQFEALVDDVRCAITAVVHPRLNSKGSSGSYFARDRDGHTVGIFKPADEEPYGTLNPKFTKWVHRQFLSRIIPFGRACLIPGLSYLSESAASILDRHLGTNIVPRTEVAALSSTAFYYAWAERERAARTAEPLRAKEGSFQVFLKGFTDASAFFRRHPFPGRPVNPSTRNQKRNTQPKRHHRRGCFTLTLLCLCGSTGAERDDDDGDDGEAKRQLSRSEMYITASQPAARDGMALLEDGFEWTEEMMRSFREELEKLVVLDFLMRNTDRGLDNFMLHPCACSADGSPAAPHMHVAAIDNSLAFPHQHPLGWRVFTYGWLFLPLSLIGQPWSASTRQRFLHKLEDPTWWVSLKRELKTEFSKDAAFREEMFERQWAVVKGQGYNLAQSLRASEEGPVELCRRPKMLVFDEFVLVRDDAQQAKPARPTSDRPAADLPTTSQAQSTGSTSVSSNSPRPPLAERRSAPADSPQVPFPTSHPPHAARSAHIAAPVVKRHHHRSRSEVAPAAAPSQLPSTSLPSSGIIFRSPLDTLTRPLHQAADDAGQSEDVEETGVALMRRLDRVEALERRRLKRARRDPAVKEALGELNEVDETEEAGVLSEGEANGGRKEACEVDEDDDEEVGPARMSFSWYGGLNSTGYDPPPDETVRSRSRWVIVERIEKVREPTRRWPWL
ncbi:1-phosphatidylinositol 4-kinase LSB6 [Rhodotorula paludigena]|uniref:1-phosphatidylinositol 4-kinase LSB6 n=1 Tax=Rhodotorula paludigena TaxID=86838 RepID=UPI00316FCF25